MKITKHEHACQVVEAGGAVLVIDPGAYTLPLTDLMGVVAIVITHEHADHWTAEHLTSLLAMNPDARILGPAVALAAHEFDVEVVSAGDTVEIAPFTLQFFGEATMSSMNQSPVIDNLGVLVNETLYYGGDSYSVPGVPVEVLAVPIGAPWLKIGEAMDYVAEVSPRRAYPVHDATLSVIGKDLANARIETIVGQGGGEYLVLENGEALEH